MVRSVTNLRHKALIGLALLIAAVPAYYLVLPTQADKFLNRSLTLASPLTSVSASYTIGLTITNPASIGSLQILFCSNDPLEADPCNVPAGLDASGATLTSQTGLGDFTLAQQNANSLLLSRTASGVTPPQPLTFTFSNIVNPSSTGSYYARLSTYASTDGTGPSVDFGGLAFAINDQLQISAKVPPYITFCSGVTITTFNCAQASGNYLNFGTIDSTKSYATSSQMLIATNAANGYNIQVSGTTLTSGNHVINAIASPDVARPGTPQFGLNLRANTDPAIGADPTGLGTGTPTASYNQPDKFLFVANDTIASNPGAENFRKYTVSYIVSTPKGQPVGVYVSTLTYVATPSF